MLFWLALALFLLSVGAIAQGTDRPKKEKENKKGGRRALRAHSAREKKGNGRPQGKPKSLDESGDKKVCGHTKNFRWLVLPMSLTTLISKNMQAFLVPLHTFLLCPCFFPFDRNESPVSSK